MRGAVPFLPPCTQFALAFGSSVLSLSLASYHKSLLRQGDCGSVIELRAEECSLLSEVPTISRQPRPKSASGETEADALH